MLLRPHGSSLADGLRNAPSERISYDLRMSDSPQLVKHGKCLVESHSARVPVPPAQAFRPIRRIGGSTGWYFADRLWRLRGLLDLVGGGVGLRRGRLDPEELTLGATIDFWRVEAYEPERLLRLLAEMRLPGRAWLQFEVEADDAGSVIRQTTIFHPTGLLGIAYWYALFPLHWWIFRGMSRRIAQAAQEPVAAEAVLAL